MPAMVDLLAQRKMNKEKISLVVKSGKDGEFEKAAFPVLFYCCVASQNEKAKGSCGESIKIWVPLNQKNKSLSDGETTKLKSEFQILKRSIYKEAYNFAY